MDSASPSVKRLTKSPPPSNRRSDIVLPTGQDFVRVADIVSQYSKHYPTSKIAGTKFEVVSVQRYDLPNGGKRDVYTLREL